MIRIVGAKDFVRPVFASDGAEISRAVRGIIDDVKARGDDALRDYTKRFDGVELSGLEVAREEIDGALSECGEEYSAMLRRSAENIRLFHEKQLRTGFVFTGEGGAVLGQRVIPLQRVGIYVPGGLAAYPSTVLMNAIPAVVAGCGEVVMVTPPPVRPQVLAAACVAGVHRVFTVGGAQAVAGLAYGTETLPKVDKITGPGNVYVAEQNVRYSVKLLSIWLQGQAKFSSLLTGTTHRHFWRPICSLRLNTTFSRHQSSSRIVRHSRRTSGQRLNARFPRSHVGT